MRLALAVLFVCVVFSAAVVLFISWFPRLSYPLAILVGVLLALVLVVILVLALIVFNTPLDSLRWRNLRGMFRRQRRAAPLADPQFGTLENFHVTEEGVHCWSCEVTFAATGRPVSVRFDADVGGPSDAQRAFYREIESRYADLLPSLLAYLEQEAPVDHEEDRVTLPPDLPLFELEGIEIGSVEAEPIHWELHYGYVPDSEWGFTVFMAGWEPDGQGAVH